AFRPVAWYPPFARINGEGPDAYLYYCRVDDTARRRCDCPGAGAEPDEQSRRHRPDARDSLDQRRREDARVLPERVRAQRPGARLRPEGPANFDELAHRVAAGRDDAASRGVQLRADAVRRSRAADEQAAGHPGSRRADDEAARARS